MAEFWINLKGRQIYIRYFAVKAKNGKYLGTVEVSQDITDVKNIRGEKRLLDWEWSKTSAGDVDMRAQETRGCYSSC